MFELNSNVHDAECHLIVRDGKLRARRGGMTSAFLLVHIAIGQGQEFREWSWELRIESGGADAERERRQAATRVDFAKRAVQANSRSRATAARGV